MANQESNNISLVHLIKKINNYEKKIKDRDDMLDSLHKQKSKHKGRLALKNKKLAENSKQKRNERINERKNRIFQYEEVK